MIDLVDPNQQQPQRTDNAESLFAQLLDVILRWIIGYDGEPGLMARTKARAKRYFWWFINLGVTLPLTTVIIGLIISHGFGSPRAARFVITFGIAAVIIVLGIIGFIIVAGVDTLINYGIVIADEKYAQQLVLYTKTERKSLDKDGKEITSEDVQYVQRGKRLLKDDVVLFFEGYQTFLFWLLIALEVLVLWGVDAPLWIIGTGTLVSIIIIHAAPSVISIGKSFAVWGNMAIACWIVLAILGNSIGSDTWYRYTGYDLHSFFTAPPHVTQEAIDKGEKGLAEAMQKRNKEDIDKAVEKGRTDADGALGDYEKVQERLKKRALIPNAAGAVRDTGKNLYHRFSE